MSINYLIPAVAALAFVGTVAASGDVVTALVVAVIGAFLSWGPIAARQERQRKNKKAQDTYDVIQKAGEAPVEPFFFYLRSFASDAATTENWQLTQSGGAGPITQSGSPKAVLEILL